MPPARLRIDETALLVVDVQEKLLPHMHEREAVTRQIGRLIEGAAALGFPILVTEQYRKGLGVTVPELAGRLGCAVCNHEKTAFSACIAPIVAELDRLRRRTVVVCGIEAHVCVLQTCLDLLASGRQPAVAIDAVTSRRPADRDAAVQRMAQAGVIPTTVESALFELVGDAGTPAFKAVLAVVR